MDCVFVLLCLALHIAATTTINTIHVEYSDQSTMLPRFPSVLAQMPVLTDVCQNTRHGSFDPKYVYKGLRYRVQFRKFALILEPGVDIPHINSRFGPAECMRIAHACRVEQDTTIFTKGSTAVFVDTANARPNMRVRKSTWPTMVDHFIDTYSIIPIMVVLNKGVEDDSDFVRSKRFSMHYSALGWLADHVGYETGYTFFGNSDGFSVYCNAHTQERYADSDGRIEDKTESGKVASPKTSVGLNDHIAVLEMCGGIDVVLNNEYQFEFESGIDF